MRGQQQTPNQSLDFYLVILFWFAVLFGIWYFQHQWIVYGVYKIRYYEGQVALWVLEMSSDVVEFFGYKIPDVAELQALLDFMNEINPETVSWSDFSQTSIAFGQYFVIPAFVIGVFLAIYMGFFHAIARYSETYTMGLFSKSQGALWVQSTPIIGKNLVDEDIDSGPWAMALRPMSLAKKYDLIFPEKSAEGKTIARLKRGGAYRIFCLQMGPLWTGLEGLPPYALALFAIFAAKADNNDKGARKLMNQISRSSRSGKLDFGGTRELLISHVRSEKVGRAVGPHAYLYTVLSEMLVTARTDGVLASSELLWLKPVDRRLWFMLSSVGRQTPFVEVAGPFAHWKIENRLRRPLKKPMVEEAVNALEDALTQIVYQPEGS